MRKWVLPAIVLGALAGLVAYRIVTRARPAESIDKIQLQQGVPVRVFEARRQDLQEAISISGGLEAVQEVVIAPTITEHIEEIHVGTGQKVARGDLLVTLDTTKSKLQVEQAQAALVQARQNLKKLRNGSRPEEITIAQAQMEEAAATYNLCKIEFDRARSLYKEEAGTLQRLQNAENHCNNAKAALDAAQAQYELIRKGPRQEDIDIAETHVKLAEVALEQARDNLDDHYLRAPCSGVVSLRQLEPGALAEAKKEIFRVVDVRKIYLLVDASELYIPNIKLGMSVEVVIDSLPEKVFTGTVAEINPIANISDRSYKTKILIDNPQDRLKPGMFGRAKIAIRQISGALVIASDAIKTTSDQSYVLFVDANNIAQRADIVVGRSFNNLTEVVSGLEEAAKVITLSQEIVAPGTKVIISEF